MSRNLSAAVTQAHMLAPERWFELRFNENKWREHAACKGMPTDFFFLEKGQGWAQAENVRIVCSECPVKLQCAEYAVKNTINDGVWGGMTLLERRRLAVKMGWIKPRQRSKWRPDNEA
jgi:WhiB family redox-sensing transcriptional regulator